MLFRSRDPLPSSAPDFVHCVVYPLLERGAFAMRDRQMAESLHAFIARVAKETGERPTVAYDYYNDRSMFHDAWYGPFGHLAEIPAPPVNWFDLNTLNPRYTIGLEWYFSWYEAERKRRHHALVDARAARAGYLHAVRHLAQEGT